MGMKLSGRNLCLPRVSSPAAGTGSKERHILGRGDRWKHTEEIRCSQKEDVDIRLFRKYKTMPFAQAIKMRKLRSLVKT
jgi:hypothetical protein